MAGADRFTSELMAELVAAFEAHRDAVRAPAMAAYMRDQFVFLGIPTPERRLLARQVTAGTPPPSERQLTAIGRACWAFPEREYQYFGADYAQKFVRVCSPRYVREIRWLATHKSWWDTVDGLAHVAGRLVAAHPELASVMDAWVDDPNVWVARIAILHQLGYKQKTDADRLFAYCTARADHPDFFIRKAIGWALREYSKTDANAVRRFVQSMDARLSPLSKREALKRITADV